MKLIKGQEAICPDGLGRIADWKVDWHQEGGATRYAWIQVDTYINNRSCQWAPHNVEVLPIRCKCQGKT